MSADDSQNDPAPDDEKPLRYATDFHAPVLSHDVQARLVTDPSGCYVDATLGGGGHARALLDELGPDGVVLGIDRDPQALAAARDRLADEREAGRFRAVHGTFGNLRDVLTAEALAPIDGLLLDLGVSSHQIDAPERGFSFRDEGPLDMRMDPQRGLTARQIVNDWGERDLHDVLREYGEESRAGRVARALCDARPLDTTRDLAAVVEGCVPPPDTVKTLTRVFQALRIAVNAELDELEDVLEQATKEIRTGGRIAVISYHSLEDRRVKRYLRYGNFEGEPRRDLYGTLVAPWAETPRGPIEASDAEIEANPRARSAHLRVAERRDDDEAGRPVPPLS
ncbi:16S rRNA (cytosine(1402)-N(4))-methyltransferase RsmH [Salinibacter altiplanensis]|uniref:16S rRNA (cytosine(1402)-N(4))-methyltransferase RsmH n=1 Tax=Salinibacter altiplanensis TaxID=1803181 RepID=UPI000C9EE860|nr:16S rRNA (cytosine(1402)-N(4))-methyltransferase RsmH [Salinibacter altiplanensis]